MPNGKEEKLFASDDLSLPYLNRRTQAHGPGDWETWYRKMARPKFQEDPNIKMIFARKASELIAQGYDKDDIESEWGMNSGVLPVMYEPADFLADLATFGLSTPGRQAVKLGAKAIKTGEKEVAKQTGKYFAKETGREVGFGAMAGGSMAIAEELGAGPIIEMMSGFIGPTATMGIATLGRKGLTTWMRRLRTNNPDLHARILREADELPDNEFARLVKEIEAPGGPPFKPEVPKTIEDIEWSDTLERYLKNFGIEEAEIKAIREGKLTEVGDRAKKALGTYLEVEAQFAPPKVAKFTRESLEELEGIRADVQLIKEEKAHLKAISTKGNLVFIKDPKSDFPEIKEGTYAIVLEATDDPMGKIKVAHQLEGKTVERFYPASKAHATKEPKEISKFPIREFEGPSTIDDALGIMQSEIETAKVIEKKQVKGKFVSVTEYPEWFTGKGWTKKQVLAAFKKKEGPIYNDLRNVAEGRLEMYGRVMGKDIAAGDLKKGDVVTLADGDEYKVAEAEAGNIRLENDETIETDEFGLIRNVVKLKEQGKLAPPERLEELAKGAAFQKSIIEAMGDPRKDLIEVTKAKQELIATWERMTLPELPEKAINVNFSRINAPEDIKMAIAKTAELYKPEIQVARRGKVSFKETEKLADDIGMTMDDLIKRNRGEAFNAEEALAARNILISSAANLVDLAKKASAPMATEVDKFGFRRALNMHYAIQSEVSGMTAEAGRALSSFRIEAVGSGEKARQIKDMLFTMEGAIPIEKQAALIATLPSTKAVSVTAKQAMKANTWDMFLEAWINGLLSGPQTHAVNMGSNALFALWQIPERYLAAGISKVTPGPQSIFAGEAAAQAWGMIEGFKDALRAAGKALKEGEGIDPLSKIEARRYRAITSANMDLDPAGPAGKAVDLLGETARLPGRFLVAEDEFFKGIGYRMELHAQAYRQAAMEGLEGDEFAKAVQRTIADPPEPIKLAAQNAARYQTYTNELGKAGKAFQQILHDVPALRLVIPFFRTGANIAKVTAERTPLAPLLRHWRADVAAGGARRDMALARLSTGSMMMLTFGTLATQGYLTGAGPPDKAARQSLRNMGWQSYSICTNPGAPQEERKYVRFSRIDPFGAFLGLAADAVEIMGYSDEVGADDIAAMVSMAIAENVSSKTWIKGVTDFIEAWSDPKRFMDNYLERMAGTLIPTGVATVERVIHPQFSEVNSWLDQIKARTPGLSKDLPARLNIWGEPIKGGTIKGEEGNWMWIPVDLFNPLYVSKGKRSPIDKEIYEQAISVGMPAKNVAGVSLTDEEYHRYVELQGKIVKDERTGKNLKDTLDLIVEHPVKAQALGITALRYDKMSDGPEGYKAATIKKIIQQFRNMAQIELRAEFQDLDRLIEDLKKEKMEQAEAMAGGM